MSITVKHLTKSYKNQLALNDVSFTIKKGEIVGFLGPNGAGKSTLMKILTTYLKPTKGHAYINEASTTEDAPTVQKSIGYLPEHNPLYHDQYVKEYLTFNASIFNSSQKRINEIIDLTGLTPQAHKKISTLSKGYRQRVGLAAALLHNPDVLILDEPTTGLDPNQLLEIRSLIKDIAQHKTILMSTHIMQEVEAICDRVIIINHGKIVADKSLQQLRSGQQQTVIVEFDYRVETVALERIDNVTTVKNTHDFIYEISFNTQTDMRAKVFDFAHDNALKILQLNQKNESLEDLFIQLTAQRS